MLKRFEKQEASSAQQRVRELEEDLRELQRRLHEVKESRQTLVDSLQKKCTETEERKAFFMNRVEDLERSCTELRSELESALKGEARLSIEKQRDEYHALLQKSTLTLEDALKEARTTREESSTLRATVSSLEGQATFMKVEIEREQKRMSQARDDLQDVQKELGTLRAALSKAEGELTTSQESQRAAERLVSIRDRDLDDLRFRISSQKSEVILLKNQLSTSTRDREQHIDHLERENSRLSDALQKIHEEIEDLRTRHKEDISDFRGRVVDSMERLADEERRRYLAERKTTELGETNMQLQDKITELTRDNDSLSSQLAQKSSQLEELLDAPPSVLRAASRASRVSKGVRVSTEGDGGRADEDRAAYESKVVELTGEIDGLKERLEDQVKLTEGWKTFANGLQEEINTTQGEISVMTVSLNSEKLMRGELERKLNDTMSEGNEWKKEKEEIYGRKCRSNPRSPISRTCMCLGPCR
eukprot:GHVO01017791.1.p1 GENE.GHVO01017791.1~~GHVO01017791.1.p1  ORF type:complete len:551 (-),score=147.55 GHVO01017791.1:38-1465(-)